MKRKLLPLLAGVMASSISLAGHPVSGAEIVVDANQVLHPISRYLTGACIEDVNHEIYGGLDSQMIFGESFAEPAVQLPLKGFSTYDGRWTLADDGSLQGVGSNGSKLIWNDLSIADAAISVDVKLTESTGGNGGLILKVNDAGKGSDAFTGYEVSLERPGFLVLGRHRQNWEPLRRVPCEVPVNKWIHLAVHLKGNSLTIFVNGKQVLQYEDIDHPLAAGAVGLRIWQHKVDFRHLVINADGKAQAIPFAYDTKDNPTDQVSGMWQPIREGDAKGRFSLVTHAAFLGKQSQQITFSNGAGVMGIANASLNRWGVNFVKGKPYEGYVYVRAEKPTDFSVALESKDGSKVYAEQSLVANSTDWQKINFTLSPNANDADGRFVIELKQPGSLTVGYAFLQPGSWGRFENLPVRKDVAEGLIHQGITVLRYGGSMVNNPEYRWKKMIGPRALRPPYEGHWYPYSSDGWVVGQFEV